MYVCIPSPKIPSIEIYPPVKIRQFSFSLFSVRSMMLVLHLDLQTSRFLDSVSEVLVL